MKTVKLTYSMKFKDDVPDDVAYASAIEVMQQADPGAAVTEIILDSDLTIAATFVWHPFPKDPPPAISAGQYQRYLVCQRGSNHVYECSWLFSGWHQRHDGCSDVTKYVSFWAELPKAPKTKTI